MEDKSIEAACLAYQNACPAKAGFLVADGTGVGTNRHDPAGPADMDVPVVVLKNLNDKMIGCMLVCHMHPTILHEDSTLVSSDFPAYVRDVLQKEYFGCECPIVYFTGAAGNQSPRHVTRENTFAEAHRIGKIVADAIGRKINTGLDYLSDVSVACSQTFVDLPKRQFPDVKKAEKHRDEFLERFERLRKTSGNTQEIRTAEVDWFGAEELFYLSKLAEKGALEQVYTSCLPAEIQIFKIGDWCFVAWPGEIFIEYAKTLKKIVKNTFLITLANGELQGYIATEEAENNGFYEASNSIFHYASGKILVDETVRLINTKA
ncbi:hypothetical protein [Maribellus luteus]|nr:hypothetical protein [Maribellus luteus]